MSQMRIIIDQLKMNSSFGVFGASITNKELSSFKRPEIGKHNHENIEFLLEEVKFIKIIQRKLNSLNRKYIKNIKTITSNDPY